MLRANIVNIFNIFEVIKIVKKAMRIEKDDATNISSRNVKMTKNYQFWLGG
jgi:hypothetical protein